MLPVPSHSYPQFKDSALGPSAFFLFSAQKHLGKGSEKISRSGTKTHFRPVSSGQHSASLPVTGRGSVSGRGASGICRGPRVKGMGVLGVSRASLSLTSAWSTSLPSRFFSVFLFVCFFKAVCKHLGKLKQICS